MAAVFVVLGAVGFALGYMMLELGEVTGIALLLIACFLLPSAIMIDGINNISKQLKAKQ